MKFNGAVLVENKRINNAYNNYSKINEHHKEVLEAAKEKAIAEVDTWSGFAKWWYKDETPFDMWVKRYRLSFFCSSVHTLYHKEFMSEDTYNWCDRSAWGLKSDMNDLYAFVSCGEPVYLNPHQARLVNEFYKEEE